jgi:hypothetical protein
MTSAAKSPYAGYRFPGEVISHAVWLYFRFPLSLCMVEEMVAARGNDVAMKPCGNGRVWSRDEVVRVDLEGCRVLCPGLADRAGSGFLDRLDKWRFCLTAARMAAEQERR